MRLLPLWIFVIFTLLIIIFPKIASSVKFYVGYHQRGEGLPFPIEIRLYHSYKWPNLPILIAPLSFTRSGRRVRAEFQYLCPSSLTRIGLVFAQPNLPGESDNQLYTTSHSHQAIRLLERRIELCTNGRPRLKDGNEGEGMEYWLSYNEKDIWPEWESSNGKPG